MSFILRFFAIFMSLIMPISNMFASLKKKTDDFSYTDNKTIEKENVDMTEYTFGEYDICVSPDGSDDADGKEDSPLKTIVAAKELAAVRRNSGVAEHINVWIGEGEYFFDKPLTFTSEDADDVSYIAKENGHVSFNGSSVISEWKEDSLNGKECVSAPIPKGASHTSVFKDGTTLPQTRYPETGYFRIDSEDHAGAKFTKENTPWSLTRGDLELTPSKEQKIKDFKNPECATLRVLHLWVDDFSKLTGYDEERDRITFKDPLSATIEEGNRYYFENIQEAFDTPGEWYSDNEKIYYIPIDGENADNLKISVAMTDRLVSVDGCNNLYFEGIEFCNTDSKFPELEEGSWLAGAGLRFPQAEYDCGGAFEVTACKGINVKYCDFNNIGLYAVKFNRIVKDSSVIGCTILNTGAGGVYIHGFNESEISRITENITVEDNLIDGYGRYFFSAIGVLLTNARNCSISNNEICNGYYSAISDGWLWGYAYSVTENNRICNNLIYNIGQGWLSDMGGIYTLGRQRGTVLSGNVIYNVAADPGQGGYGGWGIYLDEGSQYILVEKNLVYDCGSQSFHQHYGENNVIHNNIFALSKEGQMISSFGHGKNQLGYEDENTHTEFTLKNNIFLSDDTAIYRRVSNHVFKDDTNMYWDLTNGKNVYNDYGNDGIVSERLFSDAMQSQYGLYNNAVIENPGFRDPENADFTLPDNNEALSKIDFEKWNYNTAGTLTNHR